MNGSTVVASISFYGYQYDTLGRRTKSTLQDNSFWDYGYNDRSEVTSATRKTATSNPIPALSATYSFDGIGNRLASTSPMLGNYVYTPDSRNRHASITTGDSRTVAGRAPLNWNLLINGAPPDSRIGEFYFKSLTAANGGGPVWQEVVTRRDTGFPRFDRHLWFPAQTVAPTYDDDGNLTGDGRWVYWWDAENRLSYMETSPTALSVGHRVWQVQFVYDWQGRRIARHTWGGVYRQQAAFVKSERWLYDGWNVIAEFSAPAPNSTTLTRKKTYTWGIDLSGTLQGAGGVGGLLSVQTHNPQSAIHYPSYDGNGNIIAWTQNDASASTARREYDAFGNTLVAEGTAPCDFGFSTKMREEMTGLYYYGYRFYDPLIGRWLSRDPIEERGGVNLYGFAKNYPIGFWDVNGLYVDSLVVLEYQIDWGAITRVIAKFGEGISNARFLRQELEVMSDAEYEKRTQNGIFANWYLNSSGLVNTERDSDFEIHVSRSRLIEWMKHEEDSRVLFMDSSNRLLEKDVLGNLRSFSGSEEYQFDSAQVIVHGIAGRGARIGGPDDRIPFSLLRSELDGLHSFESRALTSCGANQGMFSTEIIITTKHFWDDEGCKLIFTPLQAGHNLSETEN